VHADQVAVQNVEPLQTTQPVGRKDLENMIIYFDLFAIKVQYILI